MEIIFDTMPPISNFTSQATPLAGLARECRGDEGQVHFLFSRWTTIHDYCIIEVKLICHRLHENNSSQLPLAPIITIHIYPGCSNCGALFEEGLKIKKWENAYQ